MRYEANEIMLKGFSLDKFYSSKNDEHEEDVKHSSVESHLLFVCA